MQNDFKECCTIYPYFGKEERDDSTIFPFRNVHSMNPKPSHTCARPFSVGFGPAHGQLVTAQGIPNKSGSVMINEVEEGARETVTAR